MTTSLPKMKKSFRRNSERRRRFLVGGLILAALLSSLLFGDILGSGLSYVTSPLRSLSNWFATSSGTIPAYVRDRNGLIAQIDELQHALALQEGAELQEKYLREENKTLRGLLGSKKEERIAAGVVMRPGATPYDTLLIDKGSREGIAEGSVVFAGADVVVGVVRRVFPTSALVSLVSTPGEESTVYIYGPDIFTRAEGIGGGVLRVSVPQGIDLEEGNLVVLPTIESGLYGTISHIESLESSPAQYGFVTSPVSINALRLVAVSIEAPPNITYADVLSHIADMRGSVFNAPIPQEVLISTSSASTTTESQSNTE